MKWSCKRTGYSITVGILAAILLSTVACSFVALEQLKQQVEPHGLLETMLQGIYSIDDYISKTTNDVNVVIVEPVKTTTDSIEQALYNFPTLVVTD